MASNVQHREDWYCSDVVFQVILEYANNVCASLAVPPPRACAPIARFPVHVLTPCTSSCLFAHPLNLFLRCAHPLHVFLLMRSPHAVLPAHAIREHEPLHVRQEVLHCGCKRPHLPSVCVLHGKGEDFTLLTRETFSTQCVDMIFDV